MQTTHKIGHHNYIRHNPTLHARHGRIVKKKEKMRHEEAPSILEETNNYSKFKTKKKSSQSSYSTQ